MWHCNTTELIWVLFYCNNMSSIKIIIFGDLKMNFNYFKLEFSLHYHVDFMNLKDFMKIEMKSSQIDLPKL